ncbi:MAG: hypothetical protein ACR2QO_14240 [Acidimicrobiales bacterium]
MAAEVETTEGGFANYLSVLRRRWVWLAVPMLLLPLFAVVYTFSRPAMYASSTVVSVDTSAERQAGDAGPESADDLAGRKLVNEARVAESEAVRAAVRERLGLSEQDELPDGGVAADLGSDTLVFRFTAPSPEQARANSSAWADAYVDFDRASAEARIDETLAKRLNDLSALEQEQADLRRDVDALEERLADETDFAERRELRQQIETETNAIADEVDDIDQQIAAVTDDVEQLDSARQSAGDAAILEEPEAAGEPANRRVLRNLSIGLAVGAILGLGLALAVDIVGDSARSAADLERLGLRLGLGLGALGHIPVVPRRQTGGGLATITQTDPGSEQASGYHDVRTALQFLTVDQRVRTILITSPTIGDGKSTTVSNLALAYANANYSVIVVDAHLRDPKIHDYLATRRGPGFADLTAEHPSLADVALEVPALSPRLQVVPAGERPPADVAPYLASARVTSALRGLRDQADIVLIDGPPVLPSPEAASLAPGVDAVIVVLDVETVTEDQVVEAIANLRVAGGNVIATILNRTKSTVRSSNRRAARIDGPLGGQQPTTPGPAASPAPPLVTTTESSQNEATGNDAAAAADPETLLSTIDATPDLLEDIHKIANGATPPLDISSSATNGSPDPSQGAPSSNGSGEPAADSTSTDTPSTETPSTDSTDTPSTDSTESAEKLSTPTSKPAEPHVDTDATTLASAGHESTNGTRESGSNVGTEFDDDLLLLLDDLNDEDS